MKKEMITKCYSQETYDKLDELIGMSNIRITVSEDKKCDDLEIKDSSYEPIKINMNEEKELVSIAVKDKTIYGETPKPTVKEKEVNKREPKITEKKNKKSTKKEKSTKEETTKKSETPKKADYEFETLEGYTTLQSLLININKGDRYKKIKNMADYCNYYIKTMHGVEDNGTIIVIYNSSEKDYYTKSTENVKIAFEGYHNGKIDFFDYESNGFSLIYHFGDLSGYVDKYGEEDKDYNDLREAFKYIKFFIYSNSLWNIKFFIIIFINMIHSKHT